MRTTERFFRIHRRDIAFVKFIFEAYEGIAILTTIDAKSGLVALAIPPGCETETDDVLAELGKSIRIESLSGRPDTTS